jgi:hypothetical protein
MQIFFLIYKNKGIASRQRKRIPAISQKTPMATGERVTYLSHRQAMPALRRPT